MNYIDIVAALYPGKPVTASGDPGSYSSLNWLDGNPITQTVLDGQRVNAAKLLQSNAISAQLVTALGTPFLYNSYTWDTDIRAVGFITSQAMVLTNLLSTVSTVWHDSAGGSHSFLKTDFIALHGALTLWRNACYAVSWQLKAQVAAMTTEAAIFGLDIVTPFPTSYTAAQTVMSGTIP